VVLTPNAAGTSGDTWATAFALGGGHHPILGSLQYASPTVYDTKGRTARTISPTGVRTAYVYAAGDRQARSILNPASFQDGSTNTDDIATLHTSVSSSVYDKSDRVTATTDALGRTTSYQYDQLGRTTRTTFHDGSFTLTTYDALGRRDSA